MGRRILLIDDNTALHDLLRKILAEFVVDSAYQGQEGCELARQAVEAGQAYSLAFVDMRMPPGWDGLTTVSRLWELSPETQVVICTGYSDRSWREIGETLGNTDRLVILKKPFDNVEVVQLAQALTEKWRIGRERRQRVESLENTVRERNDALDRSKQNLEKVLEDRERLSAELRRAQKMEAVGQLASGIAHEINTPIQYVGDTAHFLKRAVDDLRALVGSYRDAALRAAGEAAKQPLEEELARLDEEADLSYLDEQLPKAFERILDGTGRVAHIVGAMKEFAHPGGKEKAPADLNRALSNTLTVAKNEYKYVAELETELGVLPQVLCHVADLNQVFLNLLVNAAHATADAKRTGEVRPKIRVRTSQDGDCAVIEVSDEGCGIPEAIRGRIFEPFFTTKEIGRGTGQGLAIARAIVVDRHGGTICFDSELGRGTTFTVRLPIGGMKVAA